MGVVRSVSLASAVVAVLFGAVVLAGQTRAPSRGAPSPYRAAVDLVTINATVTDADGELVAGLPRDAFQVFEDGRPVDLQQFTNERVPIGLGLLLDISDSMFGERIADARAAVERFLRDLLSPQDEYFVLAFNHLPHPLTGWTQNPDEVRAALAGIQPNGATAAYDAILAALPLIPERTRQRAALLLISDGADTASDASIRDVRSALLRSDAFVYAIAIDSPERQAINTRVSPDTLRAITDSSGGRTEVVHSSADLVAATTRIAEELNSQYLLGYASPRPDGKYHSIRVHVARDGYRVRARNGYVAASRHD
jgi:Ca-activated chloride channel homolog